MALKDHPLESIRQFLPSGSFEDVVELMHRYPLHLKIKRERKSVLGDYRPGKPGQRHTISVNGNLNPYHFLITLLHELAHLLIWVEFKDGVKPHGKEWKNCFGMLLKTFLKKDVFPKDIREAMLRSLHNLSATTCSDPDLFKVLHQYDGPSGKLLVEHIGVGGVFSLPDARKFKILSKRRTRYECIDLETGKKYLFPAIFEVLPLPLIAHHDKG